MSGTNLGTLVTYNPWSVGPSTLLDDVAARFEELHVHHVPVVDGERRVIGMLSETDLLRARQTRRGVLAGSGLSDTDDAPLVFARDVMSRQVVSVTPATSSSAALGLLLKCRIHALPVVDHGRLVGMISSRDFVREFSYGELDCARQPVANLLSGSAPQPLDPDATIATALLTVQQAGVTCLAVSQAGRPLGVVSQRDIFREKCRLEQQAEYLQEMQPVTTILQIVRDSPSIRSNQRLCEAAAAMIERSLPAVTVVDPSNRLLGLVTEDDVLRVLYDAQA